MHKQASPGDRTCQACGTTGAPVLGDTGPACRACDSYSLVHPDTQKAASKTAEFLDRAGDKECQACGAVDAPVLADTGPACRQCGSYSLTHPGPGYPQRPRHSEEHAPQATQSDYAKVSARTATRVQTNVASSDGRILLNAGDQIKTPTGQTLKVNQVRRHETSRDHYYVDTDAGTSVVPWSTSFEVMPTNTQQQQLPGTGTPGGNFNHMPFNPQANGSEDDSGQGTGAPSACPVCGGKQFSRRGGKFLCSTCGYTENPVGAGMNFGDASQVLMSNSPRTSSLIARRAATVVEQTKETPL